MPQRSTPPQNSITRSSRLPTRTSVADWPIRFQNTWAMLDQREMFYGTHSVNTYSGRAENSISSQVSPMRTA